MLILRQSKILAVIGLKGRYLFLDIILCMFTIDCVLQGYNYFRIEIDHAVGQDCNGADCSQGGLILIYLIKSYVV